jgi:hypothetical protein
VNGAEIAHGTDYAEAMRCYRANGRRCDACRAVNSAYHRGLTRTPAAQAEARRRRKAWHAALNRLVYLRRDEFHEVCAESGSRDRARYVLRRRHRGQFNELYAELLLP